MSEFDGYRKRAASTASTEDGSSVFSVSSTVTTATTTTSSGKKRQKKGGRGGSYSGNTQPYVPPGVVISRLTEDCAPQLTLSKEQLIVTGSKGFRMARATHGVSNGTWYWECTILPPETKEGHCRLGWSLSTGSLQGPVGYDKSSYAYRDIAGSKVHESLRTDNYGEPWGPGDVVGFLIKLKSPSPEELRDSVGAGSDSGRLSVAAAAAALALSGISPSERAAAAAAASGGINASNEIRFFKNGRDQGVSFSGIKPGTYFPAVSLYMGGSVRANFGPEFVYPPPSSHRGKPIAALRGFTKDDTKAQRTRTKRERAARGLETATRQSGTAASLAAVHNGSARPTPSTTAPDKPTQSSGQKVNGGAGTRSSKGNGSSRDLSPGRTKENNTFNKRDQRDDDKGETLADKAKESPGRETTKDKIEHPQADLEATDEFARNASTQPEEGDDASGAAESEKPVREEREERSKEDGHGGGLSPMEVDNPDVDGLKADGQERPKEPGEEGREQGDTAVEVTGEAQEPVAAENSVARVGGVGDDDRKGEEAESTSSS